MSGQASRNCDRLRYPSTSLTNASGGIHRSALSGDGEPLLDFAAERNLPLLVHVGVDPDERYSQASDAFKVADQRPELRFCFAHCVGFKREFLERAQQTSNVWVDTAALKIQVQLVYEDSPLMALRPDRFDWDYSDHVQVMRELLARFPRTVLWGSDSPAYSYICRRLQSPGHYSVFRLKANYESEKAALDGLSSAARALACETNTIEFLFGSTQSGWKGAYARNPAHD